MKQNMAVISRLPPGWQGLFHGFCKSTEVAELWYMDAMQSSYGHRPEWHTMLKSLQVQDPCIIDSQLVFKPRFVMLSPDLQEKFLTFLVKESCLIPTRYLTRFAMVLRSFLGTDQETCVGRHLALLCQQIEGYSDEDEGQQGMEETSVEVKEDGESDAAMDTSDLNSDHNELKDLIIIDDDTEEPAAKRQKLDEPNVPLEEEIDVDSTRSNQDLQVVEPEGIEAEEDNAEDMSDMIDMIEKLKELLQSGEEDGFPALLSAVSKLSVRDIEWFCKRIDFAEMTDDSTELVCKHMCRLADLLSYTSVVCLLTYVIFDKVLQLTQTPSRKLSGAITLVAEKFPKQLIDSVLVPCLTQNDVSSFQAELLCRLIKDELTSNSRSYFVQKLFASNFMISESKLGVMQTVFENSFDVVEHVVTQIIECFDCASVDFVKNLKFGKLLLAIVNKHGDFLNGENKLKFSSFVDRHGTFLKKSVKSALNKLK